MAVAMLLNRAQVLKFQVVGPVLMAGSNILLSVWLTSPRLVSLAWYGEA